MASAALFLAALTGAPPVVAQQERPAEVDAAQIVEMVERFRTALKAGDSLTVARLLLPEALVLESGGRETRREYLGHHFHADHAFLEAMTRAVQERDVRVEDDVAWVSTTSRLTGTFEGRNLDLRSAELLVLRRTPEGWRVAAVHWSSRSRA